MSLHCILLHLYIYIYNFTILNQYWLLYIPWEGIIFFPWKKNGNNFLYWLSTKLTINLLGALHPLLCRELFVKKLFWWSDEIISFEILTFHLKLGVVNTTYEHETNTFRNVFRWAEFWEMLYSKKSCQCCHPQL